MLTKARETKAVNSEKSPTLPRLVFFAFFLLICFLSIYYFSDVKRDLTQLGRIRPAWLLIAIGWQFMTYLFTASIYRYLLKPLLLARLPRAWELLKASVITLLFDQTLPSAGVSGNTYLFAFLSRYDVPGTKIIELILGQLLIYYAAMELTIVALSIVSINGLWSGRAFAGTLAIGSLVYLAFAILISLLGRKNMLRRLYARMVKFKWLKKKLAQLTAKWPGKNMAGAGIQLFSLLTGNPMMVLRALLLQLLVIAADVLTLHALFAGLGYPVSLVLLLLTFVSARIVAMIPFLPGSLILYESSMTFFFANGGVPIGTAVIVTLSYRLLSYWLPMPIGTLLYRRWLGQSTSKGKDR